MTPLRTTDTNLDWAFIENALLHVALKIGRDRAPLDTTASLTATKNKNQSGNDIAFRGGLT